MAAEKKIKDKTIKVVQDDATLQEVDAFVFYAEPSLKLGSGYGGAISSRGGPTIQKELDELAPAEVTQVVVTGAGKLKAKHILHAVGPAFQEPDMLEKLRATIRNVLAKAEEQGLSTLALPAMGAGFYGVPLAASAEITFEVIRDHLANSGKLEQVLVCLNDGREYRVFESALNAIA